MKVGFIGIGTMGASMALNVRKAGYDVVVNDMREAAAAPHLKAGCTWANSAREVAAAADVVFTSLPGPKEVQAVAEELLAGMRKGTAWFDLSTNSPTVVRKLAERFAQKGIAMLDAPVSGGPSGAKSGKLALWVSGDRAAFDKHKKVLDAIGDQAIHIGPIGAGTVAKLVHNCAGYAILAALAEVFTMGVKAGVEPLALWAAVRQGAFGRRRSFDRLAEQFLVGQFDPARVRARARPQGRDARDRSRPRIPRPDEDREHGAAGDDGGDEPRGLVQARLAHLHAAAGGARGSADQGAGGESPGGPEPGLVPPDY